MPRRRLEHGDAKRIVRTLKDEGATITGLSYVKGHSVITAIFRGEAYVIATYSAWDKVKERHGLDDSQPG